MMSCTFILSYCIFKESSNLPEETQFTVKLNVESLTLSIPYIDTSNVPAVLALKSVFVIVQEANPLI